MKKIALLLIVTLTFNSCGTLFGSQKLVRVEAKDLQGVTVLVNGLEKGQAPMSIKVSADDMITYQKEGYTNKTVVVDSKFNTISILNLGNLLGWGIDIITNSLKVPNTKFYTVTLDKKE